jgi:hypothetical protein
MQLILLKWNFLACECENIQDTLLCKASVGHWVVIDTHFCDVCFLVTFSKLTCNRQLVQIYSKTSECCCKTLKWWPWHGKMMTDFKSCLDMLVWSFLFNLMKIFSKRLADHSILFLKALNAINSLELKLSSLWLWKYVRYVALQGISRPLSCYRHKFLRCLLLSYV